MIYLRLDGRIGNQLFMYAFAKNISKQRGNELIVIDDKEAIKRNYHNSLMDYNLDNVQYVHDHKMLYHSGLLKQNLIFFLYRVIRKKMSFNKRYELEKKWQSFFNRNGLILCENGYLNYEVPTTKNVFLNGYFQSNKYFKDVRNEIIKTFSVDEETMKSCYQNIEKLKNRNAVCVSIKVQHNVGNSMYDVCNDGYWKKAIDYICENVENPLFFICSDNVEYVKNNLIDCTKYDAIYQDSNVPVNISLSIMAQCKHFVIGNTTFGWWAQYLCEYDKKIVVAPSKWMKIDMPIDIYEDGWHLMEV
jgi:hypothetical protein